MSPVLGIDHVLAGVADLEAARAAWRRLGFTVTPRGRHIGWGTGNYCIMFPDDYVELLGIVDPAGDLHHRDHGPLLAEQIETHASPRRTALPRRFKMGVRARRAKRD